MSSLVGTWRFAGLLDDHHWTSSLTFNQSGIYDAWCLTDTCKIPLGFGIEGESGASANEFQFVVEQVDAQGAAIGWFRVPESVGGFRWVKATEWTVQADGETGTVTLSTEDGATHVVTAHLSRSFLRASVAHSLHGGLSPVPTPIGHQ